TDRGIKKVDSLTDNGSMWALFNHLESVKFRVRLRSSDSGSYAAKVFGGVVMVDKGIFPNKTVFTFARYQKLANDYPELPKFDENDPRFEFLEEDD
ncbi:hypothetical protein, partial [Lactobacillus acetotolerans]|uniref:hypothetical protein n=1 Tax=Lactobacillus acetotolerans TaxID=1600 RepID=UPI002FD9BC94